MTQINVKYVDDAKPGKKYGSIKDANGTKYLVPAGMNGVFQAGQVVDVPTRSEDWKDRDNPGKVNTVWIVAGHPGAAGSGVVATPPPAPPPLNGSYNQTPAPQPAPRTNRALGKEGEMFVMGVVGRAMGSGSFGVTDIDLLTKAAVQAWRNNVA